ncbi:beta-ketoacyl synthase N-terminal-like domain-containing protein [Streptomyces sp. 6N223]|uniref:beta-ketoacyl synthase N-terminal-like domain-containing protein n=1 Tax=Streptomyces sp. 6N223 TaxID=3457412 RepID=UPI003FD34E5A
MPMVTITGMGVQCAVAHDLDDLDRALRGGRSGITFEDPGLGLPRTLGFRGRLTRDPDSLLAEPPHDERRDRLRALTRRAGRSIRYSLLAAAQAYHHAGLDAVADRRRISVLVAGSNLSHQLTHAMSEKFRKDPAYVSPRYAHQMWDSDLLGVVSEALSIRGEGMTVGGASAGGNLGLIQGMRLIRSGAADVCLVVAGMQELSDVELAALANLGALGALGGRSEDADPADPAACCRPFDARHDGFVLGEGAAAIVLESGERATAPLAHLREGVSALDGHHLTQPSREGEEFVMREVLARAGVAAGEIGLVSAHATGTPLGDDTEAEAIRAVFGPAPAGGPWVNATKSLLGHCLGPAATLEAIACVLQMRGGYVHPNPNLTHPAIPGPRYAPARQTAASITYALNNSFGFGGINTSLLLQSPLTRKE